MDLNVIAGKSETNPWGDGTVEVVLIDVEVERLLDDIGIEKVMEYFDLVRRRFEY